MRDTFLSPRAEHRDRIVECLRPNGADMLPELLERGRSRAASSPPCTTSCGSAISSSPALWARDLVSPRAFGHQGSSGAYLAIDPTYELVVARVGNRWGGDPAGMAEVMNAAVAAVAAD